MHDRASARMEERIRHALRASGQAIAFAALTNVAGFLGLALSSFRRCASSGS
jgi:predicted RND superfamily exporter protein